MQIIDVYDVTSSGVIGVNRTTKKILLDMTGISVPHHTRNYICCIAPRIYFKF